MSQRIVGVILFVVMTTAGAFCQPTEISQADASPSEEEAHETPTAETAPTETPRWARNLRRAEIVATGSFPLTLLAARLTYSLLRFAVHGIQDRTTAMDYAPWFLAPPGAPELEFTEKLGIVAGAASLSSLIALIDYRRGVTGDEQEQ
ncbi:MAG: hypothetical protein KOO61_06875 [Spirochaetales bacterium]|nr:hypothetical protein [Spirochaetales bacterium]